LKTDTFLVYLVHLVHLVRLVCLVCLVCLDHKVKGERLRGKEPFSNRRRDCQLQ
jgi:hypothetical protein